MKPALGLLTLAVVVTIGSTSMQADATADEWKKLAGTWNVEAATFNGNDATATFKTAVLTIEEGKYKLVFGGTDAGTLKIDPEKKPKSMTIEGTEGPNKGKTIPAIYEIDGDTLKICYALGGAKEAPSELKSTAENKTLLMTYKREKK
jgi:uncharacterized protein (TIGR03067 family)